MAEGPREARFLSALEDLFTGAEVDGDSGFVNLMRMKHQYFQDIRRELMDSIEKRAPQDSSFREELFDKLHTFFSKYFCESGAIYFRHLPAFERTYERVYAEGADVALSWKTQDLYYVKSDTLVRSMPVELPGPAPGPKARFHFDASQIQHKRNNERRDFLFTFERVENPPGGRVLHLRVTYSEQGRRTKPAEILKAANQAGMRLGEDDLEAAFRKFRRQTEADFFIHKNAGAFLREQFDLWLYQFMFQEQSLFEQNRLAQLQAIRDTAREIIAFIAQFEDELRRAWEKPKFARNANYVVTLDRLPGNLLEKIAAHPGRKAQVAEWRDLGLVENGFRMAAIRKGQKALQPGATGPVNGAHRFLPLDTKHFKDLELEILGALGDLDTALDGELIHSENWQALNTLRKRYAGRVKCIYIDPPFNLSSSDMFDYRTNYKDSCWATMLENRVAMARNLLSDNGSIFLRCDYNGNYIVRMIMNSIFGIDNFLNQISVGKSAKITEKIRRYHSAHDTLFLYSHSKSYDFEAAKIERKNRKWQPMHLPGIRWSPIERDMVKKFSPSNLREKNGKYATRARIIFGKEMLPPDGRHWALSQKAILEAEKLGEIKIKNGNPHSLEGESQTLTDNWTDSVGYASHWGFPTENHEIVLERAIRTTTKEKDICLDFFSGIGTTAAVAQKLGRKWIGVEMGEHFREFYTDKDGKTKVGILGRMKKVLSGHASGISESVNYKGGGAFQYYTLEQYEETLKNARYKDSHQLTLDTTKSPFEQYIFINDDKFAHAIHPSQTAPGALEIALQTLYPDISLPQTLANALGKHLRQITPTQLTFTDNTTHPLPPMPTPQLQTLITTLKPYLWWGE
ncbi:MAG: site-specific DNA-methyltransferase [Deltaproteobacteria bacterium]|nr:site-specific DNA-methyltransferase [Deltaproteobacteria bacterium]